MLDQRLQTILLNLARRSIAERLGLPLDAYPEQDDPLLEEKRGAFVTLHKQGELRGCIGYIEAIKSLRETIREMAQSAAFHDPRFPPLKESEFPLVDIEISVLSPIEPVPSVDDIEVGKHGLIISRGLQRGLLLPQVASERGWDRITFLQHTCLKAGLPPDAWQKGARIEYFSAFVFGEKT